MPTEAVAGTPECVSECQVWSSRPGSASLMEPGFNLGGWGEGGGVFALVRAVKRNP